MSYLIYGAYGYTGQLIAQRAVEEGHEPVLAGRDEEALETMASSLGLPFEVVSLKAPGRLQAVLNDVEAVVHCAGPFVRTTGPMAAACLETGTHYLDITGEIPVFEALADRGAAAEKRDVMLLPGIGFDVVPTDCLARSLAGEESSATTLELAVYGSGGISKGTLKSVIEHADVGGRVRRQGALVEVPLGWSTRTVDFGDRARTVVSIPWGDLVTAHHSTGIPNITVYVALPPIGRLAFRLGEYLKGLLGWPPLKTLLQRGVIGGWTIPLRRRAGTGALACGRPFGRTPASAGLLVLQGRKPTPLRRGPPWRRRGASWRAQRRRAFKRHRRRLGRRSWPT